MVYVSVLSIIFSGCSEYCNESGNESSGNESKNESALESPIDVPKLVVETAQMLLNVSCLQLLHYLNLMFVKYTCYS